MWIKPVQPTADIAQAYIIGKNIQFKHAFLKGNPQWFEGVCESLGHYEHDDTAGAYPNHNDRRRWQVKQVLGHLHKDNSFKMKVLWHQDSGETSWIDFNTPALHDPLAIIRYARRKHILGQNPFKTLAYFCLNSAHSKLRMAH